MQGEEGERERARTLRCDLFGLFFLVIKQNRKRRRRRSGITRWAGMKTKETTRQQSAKVVLCFVFNPFLFSFFFFTLLVFYDIFFCLLLCWFFPVLMQYMMNTEPFKPVRYSKRVQFCSLPECCTHLRKKKKIERERETAEVDSRRGKEAGKVGGNNHHQYVAVAIEQEGLTIQIDIWRGPTPRRLT